MTGGMAGRAGLGPIVDVVRPVDTTEVADPALVLWYTARRRCG